MFFSSSWCRGIVSLASGSYNYTWKGLHNSCECLVICACLGLGATCAEGKQGKEGGWDAGDWDGCGGGGGREGTELVPRRSPLTELEIGRGLATDEERREDHRRRHSLEVRPWRKVNKNKVALLLNLI